jgi:Protein of unknown function (DUF2378)
MYKTKGTDLVALRQIFKELGPEKEQAFRARLSAERVDLYQRSLAFIWNDVDEQVAVYEAAAAVIHPDDPEGLKQLGWEMARRSYSGVYKILLRLPSTQFVMNQAAKLWNTYFERGRATVEDAGPHRAVFVLRDYPELAAAMRQIVRGNITAAAETTGAKAVRVDHLDADPQAWKWVVTWA